jgi:hypothetical protein
MKKMLLFLAVCCILASTAGCGNVKDALDIEFDVTYHHVFTVQGATTPDSYHINLLDDETYRKYKNKIRSVHIGYVRYTITSNTGTEGRVDFYAGSYGSALTDAKRVAQTVVFTAGETRLESDVDWIDLPFWEGLLGSGSFSLWAVGNSSGVNVILPVAIKIEVTVNPLE